MQGVVRHGRKMVSLCCSTLTLLVLLWTIDSINRHRCFGRYLGAPTMMVWDEATHQARAYILPGTWYLVHTGMIYRPMLHTTYQYVSWSRAERRTPRYPSVVSHVGDSIAFYQARFSTGIHLSAHLDTRYEARSYDMYDVIDAYIEYCTD